jgi:hypothetical protein
MSTVFQLTIYFISIYFPHLPLLRSDIVLIEIGARGGRKDLGRHYGQLKMQSADQRPVYRFEFKKALKKGASKAELDSCKENGFIPLLICHYVRNATSKPSEIIDYGDDYMFEIKGFNSETLYEVRPQKSVTDPSVRPPLFEKQDWIKHLTEACIHMEKDIHGRPEFKSRTVADEFKELAQKSIRLPLQIKKGKEDPIIDNEFKEFQGTIQIALYLKKKSPSIGWDNRLVELLVESYEGQTYAIIRYRDNDRTPEIKGFIDLGADPEYMAESAWAAGLEELVPAKGNVSPQMCVVNKDVPLEQKGHIKAPATEGTLTLIMTDRRRGKKSRAFIFKIPGSRTGVAFYKLVMEYAKDWKVKKLSAKALKSRV